jgi:hypothetical protein
MKILNHIAHNLRVEFWIEIQFKCNLLNELNSNILNGTQISFESSSSSMEFMKFDWREKEMQINATSIENMFFIYIICN